MNLLVTGANGFIGSYFKTKYSRVYNIQTFSFLENYFNCLSINNVQVVLHLSALVHQMGGASTEEYERINITQTLDLAIKAKKAGVKQFIYMSTVKVYGEENTNAYNEQSICNPQDDYGKSKLKAELKLKKLHEDNFVVTIIRTPIVYGYGVKANIKRLISLVNKAPILPFGAINNKRSMVYIGNLCHLIYTLIDQRRSGIFLANDDHPLSTTHFIELIAVALHKNIYLIKFPLFECLLRIIKPSFYKRLYDSLEINNAMTKETLKLQNPYSIEQGIQFMIDGEH